MRNRAVYTSTAVAAEGNPKPALRHYGSAGHLWKRQAAIAARLHLEGGNQ